MNETLNTLKTRRSCRNFQDKQIKEEELQQILEAGIYAANGRGRQAGKILVIQDPAIIKRLSKLNASFFNAKIDPFYGAPTVIMVLADKTVPTYVEDGSLILGNMMNAAASLGIGSCWIHRAKEETESEEGREILKDSGIDFNQYVGIGHCILGYPASKLPEAKTRKEDFIVRL